MQAYSLLEVNQYIKQVLALNFTESIWVQCEISQCKESRGQLYLDLIEKDQESNQVVAQTSGIIWFKSLLFIKKKLGKLADSILQEGTLVNLKVKIEYHERYGLKLNIEDIDPSYTLGQIELNRQKIIEQLEKENLLQKNTQQELSTVIQNIAVISSGKAAGYADFIAELESNSYGYAFNTTLFDCAVQGAKVENDTIAALQNIENQSFDLVVIIRGGGSKVDLSGYDSYKIGKAIALCNHPIITGIGHEIDNTIADLVSFKSIKTPTAVATFIVERNLEFESNLIFLKDQIVQQIFQKLEAQKKLLAQYSERLKFIPKDLIHTNQAKLNSLEDQLFLSSKNCISTLTNYLNKTEEMINILHPSNTLKRGYAMIKSKETDQYISDLTLLSKEKEVLLILKDGQKEATIHE